MQDASSIISGGFFGIGAVGGASLVKIGGGRGGWRYWSGRCRAMTSAYTPSLSQMGHTCFRLYGSAKVGNWPEEFWHRAISQRI